MSNGTHTSAACCDTPVPQASATYTPKGSYTTLAASSTKCYVTGPKDASKAICFIYDIFGYHPPTLQGADILAAAGYLVVMPDLFDGKPAQLEWMADMQTGGPGKAKLGEWMGKVADPQPHIQRMTKVVEEVGAEHKSVQKWGTIGFCWGGKLVALSSMGDKPLWACGIQSSPARVDPADAAQTTIPTMMLASKNEPADAVKGFEEALKGPKVVTTFDTQIHGWMSARADLADAEVKKEYERGYGMALDFLGKYV